MARNDQGAGPKIGQMVLYNNAGTILAAMIWSFGTGGSVNLAAFTSGTALSAFNNVTQDTLLSAGHWNYMEFF